MHSWPIDEALRAELTRIEEEKPRLALQKLPIFKYNGMSLLVTINQRNPQMKDMVMYSPTPFSLVHPRGRLGRNSVRADASILAWTKNRQLLCRPD